MFHTFPKALALAGLVAALGAGCASRTAPFNDLDQAPLTVMRLSAPTPPAPVAPTGLPAIPGISPELQQLGQQALEGLKQALPPGLVPNLTPTAAPAAPPRPKFKDWEIVQAIPIADESLRNELLDIFGDEESFQAEHGPCFTPGLGISIARPAGQPPVDLMVSLSCAQAMGDGFSWPYPHSGLTPAASQRLRVVYEQLFGPPPPSGF